MGPVASEEVAVAPVGPRIEGRSQVPVLAHSLVCGRGVPCTRLRRAEVRDDGLQPVGGGGSCRLGLPTPWIACGFHEKAGRSMLKNMRVGTKLVGLLVAPLLVLGILAGVGVTDRLQRADDARRAEQLAEVVAQAASAAHQLQLEQLRAVVVFGSGSAVGGETFESQQGVTDEALEAVRSSLEPFRAAGGPLADRADTLADRTVNLAALREQAGGARGSVQTILDGYEVLVDAATGIFEATVNEPSLPAITQDLVAATTLAGSKSAYAQRGAILAAALADGRVTAAVAESARAAGDEALRRSDTFYDQAQPDLKALLRNVQSSADTRALDDTTEGIYAAVDAGTEPQIDATRYADLNAVLLSGSLEVENEIARSVFTVASDERRSAIATVRLYLIGVSLGIVVALAVGFLVARAITRPLRQLMAAADQLATDQLPSLVERLRSPDEADEAPGLVQVQVGGRDEIGQLAKAFNAVQETTAQVATDQAALLRKGVSDLFVNLARRNQALLDRQIEFIDQLESNETDADQLKNLFRLDHLATRMRRNAESLLVLAGAEGARRRGRPVPLADVVRIGVGEVEDFTRVNLVALDDLSIDAAAAVDIAHLLAELMENATQFSPPETHVEVVGHRTRDGSYVLSVSDEGIGMSSEHLAEANEQLAHPPVMGLALSRALGFTVVGRLASRHDLDVRLTPSPTGGVTALTTIPPALLVDGPSTAGATPIASLAAPPDAIRGLDEPGLAGVAAMAAAPAVAH
ncbi:MAG: HAMP domain-containing protein, partial [Acidimicrobiia bacterium]|nr:HAMP domain-containing protein [Acidimicrobiia bacterium]